jgi:hypothetical protein
MHACACISTTTVLSAHVLLSQSGFCYRSCVGWPSLFAVFSPTPPLSPLHLHPSGHCHLTTLEAALFLGEPASCGFHQMPPPLFHLHGRPQRPRLSFAEPCICRLHFIASAPAGCSNHRASSCGVVACTCASSSLLKLVSFGDKHAA